jgi:magnesium transporter
VWLIVLVFASFVSGGIIQHYSSILQMVVILAAFIPVLTDSGGNAGTQAAAAVIRGIAIGEIKIRDVWRVVRREFLTGIIVGAGLGTLTAVRALFTGGNVILGVIVGSSMMLTVALATTLGGFLPLLFKRLGFDPALMSGPFLTTVVDATSLLIYFEIARRILQLAG